MVQSESVLNAFVVINLGLHPIHLKSGTIIYSTGGNGINENYIFLTSTIKLKDLPLLTVYFS